MQSSSNAPFGAHEHSDIQLRQELEKWLGDPDPTVTHNRLLSDRVAGTGEWFIETDTFKQWNEGAPSPLWMRGFSGNGKTFFCSTVFERVRKDCEARQIPVLFYYFDLREPMTLRWDTFIRSLIVQLLRQLPDVPQVLKVLYHRSGQSKPSDDDLIACFLTMLKTTKDARLLADAFDECRQWNILSKFLTNLIESHCPGLRIFFTSRPDKHIQDLCDSLNIASVDLNLGGKINEDIRKFVRWVTQNDPRYKRISAAGHDLLTQSLPDQADGRFRWVKMQLDSLYKSRTMSALRGYLADLPPDLETTYTIYLSKIDELDMPQVCRVFQWLSFSMEPLHIEEVSTVFHVADHAYPPFSMDNLLFNPEDIEELCPGILAFDRKTNRPSKRFGAEGVKMANVYLGNISVTDFILTAKTPVWHTTVEECHLNIIRGSIASLLKLIGIPDFLSLSRDDICIIHSLALYAPHYVAQHLDYLEQREHPHLEESFHRLLDPRTEDFSVRLCVWNAIANGATSFSNSDIIDLPPEAALIIAVRLGIPNTISWLFEHGVSLEKINSGVRFQYDTEDLYPLLEARKCRHTAVEELLISFGADVNANYLK